jgi:hypothetical protein
MRLVVQVLEMLSTDLVLHSRRMALFALLAHEESCTQTYCIISLFQ